MYATNIGLMEINIIAFPATIEPYDPFTSRGEWDFLIFKLFSAKVDNYDGVIKWSTLVTS